LKSAAWCWQCWGDAMHRDQVRCEFVGDALEPHDRALDLRIEEGDARGELAQCQAEDAGEAVVVGADAEGRAGCEQVTPRQVTQSRSELVRGGDQGRPDLLDGLRTGLVRAAVNDFRARRASNRPSWVLGVPVASPESTALPAAIASTTSLLRSGAAPAGVPADLQHHDPVAGEVPGQACAVATVPSTPIELTSP